MPAAGLVKYRVSKSINGAVCGCLVLGLAAAKFARAADAPQTEEDLQREAAIAEFTAKMKARNYPALFEKVAQEFNAQHALDVYVFISKGYHQYGIEWDARSVNLEPIREETRHIVAEERAKRGATLAANSNLLNKPRLAVSTNSKPATQVPAAKATNTPAAQAAVATPVAAELALSAKRNECWIMLAALAGGLALYRLRARSSK
jgi:hypothetical protein